MTLKDIRLKVDKKLAALNVARASCQSLGKELAQAKAMKEDVTTAQELAQGVAQAVQQQAHDQIARVVSRCLETVFEEPYEFHIHFERKRGRTEARLVFERDEIEVDPMTASGGGVVDVASFALRLSCLVLNKPPLRRLLILDEPFRFLSEGYRLRIREMMMSLAKEMKTQFIMVTHIHELRTGTVIEFD